MTFKERMEDGFLFVVWWFVNFWPIAVLVLTVAAIVIFFLFK
ncbi:hypothetical protein [Liquorilactobacillus nagelii]|jgi:hypothetical protein|nr:hypothetical protein [Liquorilactobacillus nagelii]